MPKTPLRATTGSPQSSKSSTDERCPGGSKLKGRTSSRRTPAWGAQSRTRGRRSEDNHPRVRNPVGFELGREVKASDFRAIRSVIYGFYAAFCADIGPDGEPVHRPDDPEADKRIAEFLEQRRTGANGSRRTTTSAPPRCTGTTSTTRRHRLSPTLSVSVPARAETSSVSVGGEDSSRRPNKERSRHDQASAIAAADQEARNQGPQHRQNCCAVPVYGRRGDQPRYR